MTLIDLDQPAPQAARREPSRWRRIAGTVALMLVAAGLGGFATERWQQQRSRSAVQVVVLADLSPSPAGLDGIVAGSGSGDQNGKVEVVSHIDVVNTGPAPVRMVAVNIPALGMKPDAWMRMDRLIAPGQVTTSTIVAEIDCRNTSLLAAAPATVEMATANGAHRRVAVTVDAGAWTHQLAEACPKT